MTVWEKIAAAVSSAKPGVAPRVIARALLPQITRADLLELLNDEVTHRQRTVTAGIESRVLESLFAGRDTGLKTLVLPADDPLRALFGRRMALGDGEAPLTELMTLDQWRARRGMLTRMRAGLDEAIAVCEQAEQRILAAGVSCLADLPMAA